MICKLCELGETAPGTTTITLDRDNTVVVIKGVPAEVCQNCGEAYLSESVTERVTKWANQAAARGAEVEILRYVA
jgi:YgiT-type zinc finger domain-containing protein